MKCNTCGRKLVLGFNQYYPCDCDKIGKVVWNSVSGKWCIWVNGKLEELMDR